MLLSQFYREGKLRLWETKGPLLNHRAGPAPGSEHSTPSLPAAPTAQKAVSLPTHRAAWRTSSAQPRPGEGLQRPATIPSPGPRKQAPQPLQATCFPCLGPPSASEPAAGSPSRQVLSHLESFSAAGPPPTMGSPTRPGPLRMLFLRSNDIPAKRFRAAPGV